MIAHFNGREKSAGRTLHWQWIAVFGLLCFVTIYAPAADLKSPAASTNAFSTPPLAEMPSAASSLFRVVGALAIVIAIFFGGVWIFRNWQRTVVCKGRSPKLNILETKALGQRHSLYLVGYEQQRLLIAASPSGVTMLTTLPTANSSAAEETPATRLNFADALRQALRGRS